MRDPWRRRLDALNEGRPLEPPSHSLPPPEEPLRPPVEPPATARLRIMAGIGVGTSVALFVIGLILAFPLAWERKAQSCSALESLLARQAYQWTGAAGAPRPTLRMMPNSEVPAWFHCYLVYWRRLEVKPVGGEALLQFARSLNETHAAYLVGSGLALALLGAVILIRHRRRAAGKG